MKTRKKMILALGAILALGMGVVKTAAAISNPADLDLDVTFNGQLSVTVDGLAVDTVTLHPCTGPGLCSAAANPGANDFAAPIGSDTVSNNGSMVEKWELNVSTINGGGNWELNNATGSVHTLNNADGNEGCTGICPSANQYAIDALFSSSTTANVAYGGTNGCPDLLSAEWGAVVDTVPVVPGWSSITSGSYNVYTSTAFVAGGASGVNNGAPNYPDSGISGLSGVTGNGDMLPPGDQIPGTGTRALCVRVTMPSAATTVQQVIQLEITAIGG